MASEYFCVFSVLRKYCKVMEQGYDTHTHTHTNEWQKRNKRTYTHTRACVLSEEERKRDHTEANE